MRTLNTLLTSACLTLAATAPAWASSPLNPPGCDGEKGTKTEKPKAPSAADTQCDGGGKSDKAEPTKPKA